MARPLRIEFPEAFYHLTARGNERKPIFRDDRDRGRLLDILGEAAERYRLVVHAYVLMRNHYHVLLQTREANLSRAVRHLNGVYTQYFNRRHRRVGHLFQGRYKALLVDKDSYLLELSRYIHLNPVRVGEVSDPARFRWSSAGAYVGRRSAPPFLYKDDVLSYFGARRATAAGHYAEFLRERVARATKPWDQVIEQSLLGSEQWVERIRRRLKDRGRHLEVPATRTLPPRPSLDEILRKVSRQWKVPREELLSAYGRRGSGARGVAMHLAHELGGLTQSEIATTFGITHFGVSKAIAATRQRMGREKRFERDVEGFYTYFQT